MNDREEKMRHHGMNKRVQTWLVVGACVLILLLLFWSGIADMLGYGAD